MPERKRDRKKKYTFDGTGRSWKFGPQLIVAEKLTFLKPNHNPFQKRQYKTIWSYNDYLYFKS